MSGGAAQVLYVLDSLPLAALVYDQDLHCVGYNGKAQMLVRPDRPVHDTLHMHAPDIDASTWAGYLHSAMTRSRPITLQPVAFYTGHVKAMLRITISPIRDESDGIVRTGLVTFEDLYLGGGSDASGSEQSWLLQLAHRINGPLDGALRSLSLALAHQDPAKAIDHIKASRKALLAARTCVRQVLEQARYRLAPAVSVQGLIEQAIDAVRAQWDGGPIEVQTCFADDLPKVRCPALVQVMCNIVTNAFQAMAGGGTLSIRARIDRDGYLRISISDTGPGIDPQWMDRIFEPFFTTKLDGTGLGLAICKDMVEQYGGTIEIQNLSGAGAMVTIRLPLTRIT